MSRSFMPEQLVHEIGDRVLLVGLLSGLVREVHLNFRHWIVRALVLPLCRRLSHADWKVLEGIVSWVQLGLICWGLWDGLHKVCCGQGRLVSGTAHELSGWEGHI